MHMYFVAPNLRGSTLSVVFLGGRGSAKGNVFDSFGIEQGQYAYPRMQTMHGAVGQLTVINDASNNPG